MTRLELTVSTGSSCGSCARAGAQRQRAKRKETKIFVRSLCAGNFEGVIAQVTFGRASMPGGARPTQADARTAPGGPDESFPDGPAKSNKIAFGEASRRSLTHSIRRASDSFGATGGRGVATGGRRRKVKGPRP